MSAEDLKPYPEYKHSGHPWLGKIPTHWEVRRNGRLFAHRVETGFPELPVLEVSLRTGVRVRDMDSAARKQVMSDFSKYKRACKGDIAYNMMRMWQGAVGIAPVDGLVSPAYVVARPQAETNVAYCNHVFRTDAYLGEVNNASRGIVSDRNRLYWDEFKQIGTPFPPPDEQAAIVRFLSALDRRVNRFVRAKRRLIELLTEQKQAIITHAVTRGLNPNAKLKPSGIDWLGDVPAHWEVTRLSAVASFANGKAHEQFVDPSGEFVCVTARFVSTGGQFGRPCTRNFCPAMTGDVLMVMSDLPNGRALARAYYVEEDNRIAVNQRVCRLRSHSINAKFLCYYANRNVQLLRQDDGWNQTHLSNSDFKTMRVLVPPSAEQEAIVAHLDVQTRTADVTINTAEREIALIREYRTRLVSDVVTGKLDVHAAAERLPVEAGEVEEVVEGADEADEGALETGEEEMVAVE